MPNLIIGLKYQPPHEKVETEQQLAEVFSDMKKCYDRFSSQFRITNPNGEVIDNFKKFLNIAIEEKSSVVLTGNGDIGGLVVKDASLEYDLSLVSALTRNWDQYRDGSCLSCHNHYYDNSSGDAEHACTKFKENDWSRKCPGYDAYRRNSNKKPAKKLAELIEKATK
jgi:hypothetical protein